MSNLIIVRDSIFHDFLSSESGGVISHSIFSNSIKIAKCGFYNNRVNGVKSEGGSISVSGCHDLVLNCSYF